MLFAGTSGFSYTEWRGSFYEAGLPEAEMLRAYSAKLPTVEINNTFYRLPKPSVFEGWRDKTPAGFCFALKAPRSITHISKLKNVEQSLGYLLQGARCLGDKLGPILFQLPPSFRKDTPLLAEFCARLPSELRAAFEFRHESWFCDEVYAALGAARVALCAAEVEDDEGPCAPFLRTTDFVYVRLRRAAYDSAGLGAALEKIQALGVERAYVYLKHEVLGPSYALELMQLAAAPSPKAPRKRR